MLLQALSKARDPKQGHPAERHPPGRRGQNRARAHRLELWDGGDGFDLLWRCLFSGHHRARLEHFQPPVDGLDAGVGGKARFQGQCLQAGLAADHAHLEAIGLGVPL